jgi:type I restriction enzyme, S subunit
VIGRVGQFCGCVAVTSGPSWITDNALMAKLIDSKIDIDFLALCLEDKKLNQMKIGNYLPLVNQNVVHETLIPLPDLPTQHAVISEVRMIDEAIKLVGEQVVATNAIGMKLCEALME